MATRIFAYACCPFYVSLIYNFAAVFCGGNRGYAYVAALTSIFFCTYNFNIIQMFHILGIIAIMMAISFVIAMAVALIIERTTSVIERFDIASSKPNEVNRARRIHKLSKKMRKRTGNDYARKHDVELVDHYYGDNSSDGNASQQELLNHFYPKK